MLSLSSQPFIDAIHKKLRVRAAVFIDRGIDPQVAVVLVGENPESLAYVKIKEKHSKEDGIILSLYHLPADTPFAEIANAVQFLAGDSDIHGIVLQLPLPEQFTTDQLEHLIGLIPPAKDVDGLRADWESLTYTQTDTKRLVAPQRAALPPMVLAVQSLLNHYKIDLSDKKIVIVGRGRLVGQPLARFFHKLGLDVGSVDEETDDIISITKEADVLITGTGVPDLITYQWVKEGATVIDCSGDVHVDSVKQVAAALSPAKGGIGPLTVAWLLNNALNAVEGAEHV